MKIKHPSKQFHRVRAAASRKWLGLAVAFCAAGCSLRLSANPTGMTVRLGTATAQTSGAQLNLTVSQVAFLNWSSFNIQAGETTTFIQPSANSVVLNEIGGASPSQIFGNLNANGTVILANANGFYFGPNSMVKVGGDFIATTAPITPDFGSGSGWTFTGMPPLASIINYGSIQAGNGRSLFLIAENIQNNGSLNAPGGNIGLAAGQTVLVSERPDGRGLSASVQVPAGSVNNLGQITADAGTIALQAQVVNQNGIIQANSVQNQNGVIELIASDQLSLGANSRIIADGDNASSGSSGGSVTLKSGNTFSDDVGSQISVTGGAQGGNGGNVEISAPNILSLNSSVNAGAQTGSSGGSFALDPINIILGNSGTTSAGTAGTIDGSGSGPGTLNVNVNTAFQNITAGQILLEASGDITLNANTVWNLSSSTGNKTSGQLTLEAGGNIYFGNKSKIMDANNWSVTLDAGYNAVQPGAGSIYLGDVVRDSSGNPLPDSSGNLTPASGSGSIQTAAGNINLTAGGSVLVGSGYIVTTGGGNIFADAQLGDINTGTKQAGTGNTGYTFNTDDTYAPSTSYGGIGTYGGGNVALIAGDSINPITARRTIYGVAGAFGSAAGNVTLIAGNQIAGTFNVANGTGTILAGTQVTGTQASQLQNPDTYAATLLSLESSVTLVQNANANIGSLLQPVTLGLIGGSAGASWNLWAANNINVLEVRNPNGSMNPNAVTTSGLFDYAPDAAANFWAGNSITLGSLSQDLSGNGFDPSYGANGGTAIYCPSLSLTAGAGGITINNSIVLYPSSQGSLKIISGGDLLMAGDNSPSLTMSDSALTDYNDFTSHASSPLHRNDPNPDPVDLDVSGSIYNFDLIVPTFANITVGGSTYNFGFTGQNLSAAQTTSIKVTGDIVYPDSLNQVSVQLAEPLPAEIIAGLAQFTTQLTYDNATGTLTCNGQMSASEINFLLHPTDSSGQPLAVTLDAAQLAAVQTLYADSQSAHGLALDGFGQFKINARNIDLGISGGITVDFPNTPDTALTTISPFGADINVTTSGNLDMTATEIANGSLLGGIDLSVGGTLDVGGTATMLGSANSPKGIFTTSGGNINVTAGGDVNVDRSRIAAFNGGNINVTSQNGDVNAGSGGQGFVILQALQLDPVTGQLNAIGADIPFSGILATTVFGSDAALGNITVNAPNGSINSSSGGILQIAFNSADTRNNFIDLTAGQNITATGSGVLGYNIQLKAGGNITGLVYGSQSVNINSQNNVDVTVVSGGNVDINASGEVSGTVISGGSLDVSGGSITASLIAESVSASGDTSGASMGIPQSNVTKDNTETAEDVSTVASNTNDQDDDLNKKKGKSIALSQKTGRVTVILPPKQQQPKAQTLDPRI